MSANLFPGPGLAGRLPIWLDVSLLCIGDPVYPGEQSDTSNPPGVVAHRVPLPDGGWRVHLTDGRTYCYEDPEARVWGA